MKLISCYIENFGGLSRFCMDFEMGLTVIHAPNGSGKTTLAEFLRAMFYGFPRRTKTLDKSRRQKYAPWGGGTYGGNLVFEHEGVRYRLERTFGETPRGDSFRLIDLETGRRSDRFSEEIGTELFRLDADSFERSTYLPQIHDGVVMTTAAIQARLTRLVEDSGDLGNFDRAMAALKTRRSAYVPYRGSGGAVAEAVSQISGLQQELDRAAEQEAQLHRCTERIGQLEDQISALKNRIDLTRKQWEQASRAAAERERYDDLYQRHAAAEAELRLLAQKYPRGIPREQDIDEAWKTADELAALESRQVTVPEDADALRILKANEDRFALGTPNAEELETAEQDCRRYATLLEKREGAGFSGAERQQFEQLRQKFGSLELNEEELDALAEENRQLLRHRAVLDTMEKPAASAGHIPALLIPAALTAVAGIVLLILRQFLPGGILLAVGLAAVLWGLMGANRRSLVEDLIRSEKYAAQEKLVRSSEEKLRCRLGNTEDYDKAISALRLELGQYRAMQKKQSELGSWAEELDQELDEMEQKLRKFFTPFYEEAPPDRFGELLTALRRDAESYILAGERVSRWHQRKADHEIQLRQCEATLDAFFARFALVRSTDVRRQLQQIWDDGKQQRSAVRLEQQLASQLRRFPAVPEKADPDILKQREHQLNQRHHDLTEELLRCRQEQRLLQSSAEQIPELKARLEYWQERKTADQQKARQLDDTMEFLQKSREKLTTGYLGPIRESFGRYMTLLTGQEENAILNTDLEVRLERQGQARELAYFSAGQADTVMLCMRLALVDALFTEVKPFVILDDPFVNLDDERTAEALKLLQTLSRQQQIIYLTCSRSRTL